MNLIYNLLKVAGRKPIRKRGIRWIERYRKRSFPLKKRFEKEVGYGSYFRWEGHDFTTNSMYYIVVGPSIKRNVGKMFFAGIKKIPIDEWTKDPDTKTYSPYGEYFPTMKSALIYASRRWGLPIPKDVPNYKRMDLVNAYIPEHVKA